MTSGHFRRHYLNPNGRRDMVAAIDKARYILSCSHFCHTGKQDSARCDAAERGLFTQRNFIRILKFEITPDSP